VLSVMVSSFLLRRRVLSCAVADNAMLCCKLIDEVTADD
jgi:hypothetical protein